MRVELETFRVFKADAFVTENAMTRVIAQLRKPLGEDSKEAKYIETIPLRGYRFIADVKAKERDENVEPEMRICKPGKVFQQYPLIGPDQGTTITDPNWTKS